MQHVQKQEIFLQEECYTEDFELTDEEFAEYSALPDNAERDEYLSRRLSHNTEHFTHKVRESLELEFVVI